jgi:hypothetical protein
LASLQEEQRNAIQRNLHEGDRHFSQRCTGSRVVGHRACARSQELGTPVHRPD